MPLHGSFKCTFAEIYHRHDKRARTLKDGSRKSQTQRVLRCFPQCSENGHVESGLCGSSLSVNVQGMKWRELSRLKKVIHAYGEFCESRQDDQLRSGALIPLVTCVTKERTRESPTLPFIRGTVSVLENITSGETFEPDVLEIKFNTGQLPWHYSWASTKHTCNIYHTFVVRIFFSEPESKSLEYIGSVSSPMFRVGTRRRHRAEIAARPSVDKNGVDDVKLDGTTDVLVSQNKNQINHELVQNSKRPKMSGSLFD